MEEIAGLLEMSGVLGAVFHRGKNVVSNQFPRIYGSLAVEEMCQTIAESFTAYASVGRIVTEEILQFAEGSLLILTIPPREGLKPREPGELINSPFLTFLLENTAAAPRLVAPAKTFLLHQTRVDTEAWQQYHDELLNLLGKLINRTQCEKLMTRVLKDFAPQQHHGLPRDKFLKFGQALVKEVPNRAKHESLLIAIDKIITKIETL